MFIGVGFYWFSEVLKWSVGARAQIKLEDQRTSAMRAYCALRPFLIHFIFLHRHLFNAANQLAISFPERCYGGSKRGER
jgi:hypothetical protein